MSRYHQNDTFYLEGEGPNHNDHDYPKPGYLLTPSGYFVVDPVTGTGQLFVVLRAFKFQSSNAQTHCNDILESFEKCKPNPIVFMNSDSGADWNLESMKVFFFFMQSVCRISDRHFSNQHVCPG